MKSYLLIALVWVLLSNLLGSTIENSRDERNQAIADAISHREYEKRNGAAEAEYVQAHDSARYCIYGRSAGLIYLKEWNDICIRRFRIRVAPIAGCMISESLVKYANDYNAVILQFVGKNYGPSAWAEARAEGENQYRHSKH